MRGADFTRNIDSLEELQLFVVKNYADLGGEK